MKAGRCSRCGKFAPLSQLMVEGVCACCSGEEVEKDCNHVLRFVHLGHGKVRHYCINCGLWVKLIPTETEA